MKVIIFGASGSIGRQLVQQALDQGHQVTAFVREPIKVGMIHENLHFSVGNVLEPFSVEQAIRGHEAVLCSIGAGARGGVRAAGTRNIVHAMEKLGVQRLICQSTLGIGDSRDNLNAFWKYLMFGLLLRSAYNDHIEQEYYVKQSQLDWTIVRPAAFIDGERTGEYQHGFSPTDKTTRLKISRKDVADFMLRQLVDSLYLYKTPGLSY